MKKLLIAWEDDSAGMVIGALQAAVETADRSVWWLQMGIVREAFIILCVMSTEYGGIPFYLFPEKIPPYQNSTSWFTKSQYLIGILNARKELLFLLHLSEKMV